MSGAPLRRLDELQLYELLTLTLVGCQWTNSRAFSHYRRQTSCLFPTCRKKEGPYSPAGRRISSTYFTPNSQTSSA